MNPIINYNPDVLTCLANLSNDEVFTPPAVVNQMLDQLPEELWSDKDATFLDPVSKTGVFLREIAVRLNIGLEKQIPDKQERINHIYTKQLFGLALTELTSLLSRRSVYCSKSANGKYSICDKFADEQGNIIYERLGHTWSNGRCTYCGANESEYNREDVLENYAYQFIHTDKPETLFYNMKFDVIIGNPPYQLSTGGSKSQATPLYNKFVDQAKKLNPRFLSMIIPDRWFSGGFGLGDFRKEMLKDDRIRRMHIFPVASDVFPGVDIPGGICYFLWDRENRGICEVTVKTSEMDSTVSRHLLEKNIDIFIRYNEAVPIINKVKLSNEHTMNEVVSAQKPFALSTTYVGRPNNKEGDITVVGRNKTESYISKGEVTANKDLIDKWKVFISAAYGERTMNNFHVLGKPFIGKPGTICTETYIAIGPVKNKKEAEALCTYIRTRFFRFLVLMHKPTQHTLRNVYSFVPVQDFSEVWTDEKLYKKYSLSSEEIDFIESLVRNSE
jgi:site-specific DNA-methyltransferase (adenine-specific)